MDGLQARPQRAPHRASLSIRKIPPQPLFTREHCLSCQVAPATRLVPLPRRNLLSMRRKGCAHYVFKQRWREVEVYHAYTVADSQERRVRMDTKAFLDWVQRCPWYKDQIVHQHQVPVREAMRKETSFVLHPRVVEQLQSQGIKSLYSHQAQALDAVAQGKHIIVSTPAASGKILCYNLRPLTAVLEDKLARAPCLFPTKVLTQDQHRHLQALTPPSAKVMASIYDGDTPQQDRVAIRARAQILLTNPDMLHVGILPNHRIWA